MERIETHSKDKGKLSFNGFDKVVDTCKTAIAKNQPQLLYHKEAVFGRKGFEQIVRYNA